MFGQSQHAVLIKYFVIIKQYVIIVENIGNTKVKVKSAVI